MTNDIIDIRDIKGFVPVPLGWWWLVIVLALLVIAAVSIWLWKRKKPTTATEIVVPPTALEIAIEALRQLQEDNPPVEQFFIRLSNIVRQYLEARFALHAPERTTEEFLCEVSQNRTLSEAHKELLGAFLQECDLVKFARHQPDAADRQRAFRAAERFLREVDWRGGQPAGYTVDPVAQRAPLAPEVTTR